MKKYVAEFVGTFTLVLLGCGTAAAVGGADAAGVVAIALAFGLALIAAAYAIGPVSGCHINPAVSLGAFVAGRMKGKDLAGYIVAQILGAIIAAAVLLAIVKGQNYAEPLKDYGLGANGYGPVFAGSPVAGYKLWAALIFELVATFLFVVTILGVTQKGAPAGMAGLVIGLTLVAIHLFGIKITGTSVNPARSIGPAIFALGGAIKQLWLFIVAPCVGAAIAGALFRTKLLTASGK